MPDVEGIEVRAPIEGGFAEILTPEALSFLVKLQRRFGPTRETLLRKRAERQVQQEQQFLRQLIQAHERDRQLMAYEIHDGLVQVLSGALLHLESFSDERTALTPRAQAEFQVVLNLMRRAVADSRRVISGLRPPILDEHGIVMAVDYLVAEHAARGQFDVRFAHDVQFVPAVGPFECGMRVLIPLHARVLAGASGKQLHEALAARYAGERFVRVLPIAEPLDDGERYFDPEACNGTNRIDLHVVPNPAGHVLLVAIVDNLGKGAAGAAVQNLNLMLGRAEASGLRAE